MTLPQITAILLSLAAALSYLNHRWLSGFSPHVVKVLTWSGLRGGISVALALALCSQLGNADQAVRDTILVMTYAVVAFSIIVQGLTISPLMRRWGLVGSRPRH